MVHPHDLRDDDLRRHLDAWVSESLITRQEADAIRAFETEAPLARRVPLITEVLAYLGAALAIAAGAVVAARVWDELSPGGHTAVLAAGFAVCAVGGALLRSSPEPAFDRVSGVLWLLAVGAVAGCAGVVATELFDLSDRWVPVVVGGAATIPAAAMYVWRRTSLQQTALAVGILVLVTGAWQSSVPVALSWWTIGIAWAALGWKGALTPQRTALLVGAAVALIGPRLMGGDALGGNADAIALPLGILTAAGVLVASAVRGEMVLLVPGAVALFAYLVATIARYLGDTLGMPIVLLLAGVVLLVVAFFTTRLRAFGRERAGGIR